MERNTLAIDCNKDETILMIRLIEALMTTS